MKEKNKNFKRLMIFAIAVTMCLSTLAVLPTASSDCPENWENIVAIDISKGQSTDYVSNFIADLEARGYTVDTIWIDSITDVNDIPNNVKIIILLSAVDGSSWPHTPYTDIEASVLEDWVMDGGDIMILSEHHAVYGYYFSHYLTEAFGVTHNGDTVTDSDDQNTYQSDNFVNHPILQSVNTVELGGEGGTCSFTTSSGAIIYTDNDGTAIPSGAPVAVALEWGDGRVAIFGDSNWIHDNTADGIYNNEDNSIMAINTIYWLNDQQPYKPSIPEGDKNGKIRKTYSYTSSALDPNGDEIYLLFDWGDGNDSGWIGPQGSGSNFIASHSWNKEGTYSIRAIAKDVYGAESEWSDPLSVSMPKNKAINTPFLQFLENHPHLFPLLQKLLELK